MKATGIDLARVLLLVSAIASSALAHELPSGVGTQTFFYFHPDHLEIEFNFGISQVESWNYLERIDKNGDGTVSKEESLAFIDGWGETFLQTMDLELNGRRPAKLEIMERWDSGIQGRLLTKSLDAYYKIHCPLPPELPSGGWWLHYRDTSFMREESQQINWVRYQGQEDALSFWIFEPVPMPSWGGDFQLDGRAATIFLDDEFRSDIRPGETPIPLPSELRELTVEPPPEAVEVPEPGEASQPVGMPASTEVGEGPERSHPTVVWASIGAIAAGVSALVVHLWHRARQRS